ncbi:hypothetical protein [Brucella anthropi]|uniref:hypothetical protein n=1 Tax=Brucella anthropi TaxID=529 RepID=UPI001185B14D|nr:hypothetical protein [Brucella anthropi]KAB2753137.1 hypothetical protein F9K95_04635 [Brucella anthropi]KAB2784012.1 hypothetical protein F9K99_05740 [Brucella anthropi]QQC25553.1 hypothetical protein I6H96_01450 [Brucella anthropi]
MRDNEFPVFLIGMPVGAGVVIATALIYRGTNGFDQLSPNVINSISAAGAAILGAIVGGFISWLVARQTASEARRDAAQKEATELKAALLRVQLKVIQITNGLHTNRVMFRDARQKAADAGESSAPLWTLVQQTAGPTNVPRFEIDEFVPLVHDDGTNLIHRLNLLEDRYRATSDGLVAYSNLRAAFQEKFAQYTVKRSKNTHITAIPRQKMQEATLRMQELDSLINQIEEYTNVDFEEAKRLVQEVNQFAIRRLSGRETFVKYEFKEA